MSTKQSDCDIKNTVWYQQHLEKLRNKRNQDGKPASGITKGSETPNSTKKATWLPFTDKPWGSPAAEVSQKEPPQSSNMNYPNWNSAPPCGHGPGSPTYMQTQNLMFGAMRAPMSPPPFMGSRHGNTIPGSTPFIQNTPPWQSNSQSFPKSQQNNKSFSTQGEKVSYTSADAEDNAGEIGTRERNSVNALLEKPAAVKYNQFASWQPQTNDTSAGIRVTESTKPDGYTVQVEKRTVQRASNPELQTTPENKPEQSKSNNTSTMTLIPVAKDQALVRVDIRSQIEMVLDRINKKPKPETPAEKKPEQSKPNNPSNMTQIPVAEPQVLAKDDIRNQIEMVLDRINKKPRKYQNDKVVPEKSDAYLEHMKKLQEKASLLKESETDKLDAPVSNALNMPQSDAYLEHVKKLRAKNRPNEEESSAKNRPNEEASSAKNWPNEEASSARNWPNEEASSARNWPNEEASSARNRSNEEALSIPTEQQHANPIKVVSLNRPYTTKQASYGKTVITITDQQHLNPNQVPSSARIAVALKPTSFEKMGETNKAPVTTKKELPPCSGGQRPTATVVQTSDKMHASRESEKPAITEKTGSLKATPMQIKKEASPYSRSQHSAKQSRSPHGQQTTGSTWGQSPDADAPSRSSHTQSEPMQHLSTLDGEGFVTLDSTFDEDICEEQNSLKPCLRSILKRNQSDNKSETIPTKAQRCDSEALAKPDLPVPEPDGIEVMPSLPQDSRCEFENSKNYDAQGLDFIHTVSGYHCVLCNTFYHDYLTVLHHCTLLTHKMKIQKAQSLKNT